LSELAPPARVSVRILEKEYQFTCAVEERAALLDSAEFLNAEMRKIRESGKVIGLDRIAVMAALNMANELLRLRARDAGDPDTVSRIRSLRERVETSLARSQQLEL
jgi:cell division protein ZapA